MSSPTPEHVHDRLVELRVEYERGTALLSDLEAQAGDTRDQLLRIAGAIRVLEELSGEASSADGSAP